MASSVSPPWPRGKQNQTCNFFQIWLVQNFSASYNQMCLVRLYNLTHKIQSRRLCFSPLQNANFAGTAEKAIDSERCQKALRIGSNLTRSYIQLCLLTSGTPDELAQRRVSLNTEETKCNVVWLHQGRFTSTKTKKQDKFFGECVYCPDLLSAVPPKQKYKPLDGTLGQDRTRSLSLHFSHSFFMSLFSGGE